MTFPTYDPETDAIRLHGNAVALLTVIMKAKFGDKLDPEMLFHADLSKLAADLAHCVTGFNSSPDLPVFSAEDLSKIGAALFDLSEQIGWWSQSIDQRAALLQEAASPWVLSDKEIETILDDIESRLSRSRRITAAADAVSKP
jgi:hypothetical protein